MKEKPQMWPDECFRNGGLRETKGWKPSYDAGAVGGEKHWNLGAMAPRLSADKVKGDHKHNEGPVPEFPNARRRNPHAGPVSKNPAQHASSPSHTRNSPPIRKARIKTDTRAAQEAYQFLSQTPATRGFSQELGRKRTREPRPFPAVLCGRACAAQPPS